jgi:Fe-S cluster assembly iron-binding protein IscA
MFAMTPRARSVVERVTGHQALSARSGLRIARGSSAGAPMQVEASAAPREHDEVLERDGARVFLGPGAMERLRGRTLDAVTEKTGRVRFVLKGGGGHA